MGNTRPSAVDPVEISSFDVVPLGETGAALAGSTKARSILTPCPKPGTSATAAATAATVTAYCSPAAPMSIPVAPGLTFDARSRVVEASTVLACPSSLARTVSAAIFWPALMGIEVSVLLGLGMTRTWRDSRNTSFELPAEEGELPPLSVVVAPEVALGAASGDWPAGAL